MHKLKFEERRNKIFMISTNDPGNYHPRFSMQLVMIVWSIQFRPRRTFMLLGMTWSIGQTFLFLSSTLIHHLVNISNPLFLLNNMLTSLNDSTFEFDKQFYLYYSIRDDFWQAVLWKIDFLSYLSNVVSSKMIK